MTDPFGTAGLRRRVLDAWAAAPARFREDANAEEDFALGGYRDRVLVELAQNAADAAARSGEPGVLRLRVADGALHAANTGEPLSAAGVESLASLRASAKRDGGQVGRFGVGFAAVLALSDEPAVVSRTGGVRFSAEGTRAEVAAIASLEGELARRGGAVPVLRLPWPAPGSPPDGFSTEVVLPLRAGAEPAARAALDALGADLLLALPGLARIELPDRVLTRVDTADGCVLGDGATSTRWTVVRAGGDVPPELLADRPTEDRARTAWALSWAVPVAADGHPGPLPPGQVIHAPTPSDEPLSLPVRLVATFPMDSARRHVAPGPLTDFLVDRAAAAYPDLLAALPTAPGLLALVPRLGLAAAELDAAVARRVLGALREATWLPDRVAPADAVVADAAGPDLVAALDDVVAGLLPAGWSGRGHAAALTALGVRRLGTAQIVELVAALDRSPDWWRRLYAGLADRMGESDRDALGALPVPLVDGRTVTGPRGLLLSESEIPHADVLGLRLVHPDAAHPLLERLGATPTTPAGLLQDAKVRAAVESSLDEDDPEPVAQAVLGLVRAAGPAAGEYPWLAELALPADDGQWSPAGELVLPGSPLAGVLDPDGPLRPVRADLVERWGPDVLRAAGVLDTFAVLRVPDADLGEPDHDLAGEAGWHDAALDRLPPGGSPPRVAELVAVRDLELVRPDAWRQALRLLAGPDLRAAVEPPAWVDTGAEPVAVPSYTSWWLAHHEVWDGRRPVDLRLPAATDLAGLYDVAGGDPEEMDLAALAGALRGLPDVLADPDLAEETLDRLADPDRTVSAVLLRDCYARLAGALSGYEVRPPAGVRVAPDRVVPRERVMVLDAPHLLPLLAGWAAVPGGVAVADLLDLPLASELTGGEVTAAPREVTPWCRVPGVDLAAARCGAPAPDGSVATYDGLTVTGGQRVTWWPGTGDAPDHVDAGGGAAALGRVLAWRLGRWDRRAAAGEAFAAADEERLRAEDAAEGWESS